MPPLPPEAPPLFALFAAFFAASSAARLRIASCSVSSAAKAYMVDNAYDPVYGARPLRRFVQRQVETLIGKTILAEDLLPGSTLAVDVGPQGLTVSPFPPAQKE